MTLQLNQVAETLDVPLDDVEKWVVDTITSKLIDAKMDQLKKVRYTHTWHNRMHVHRPLVCARTHADTCTQTHTPPPRPYPHRWS